MLPFSQRHKHRPVKDVIQVASLSADARTRLWNYLNINLWRHWNPHNYNHHDITKQINSIFIELWLHYFKNDFDEMPPFLSEGPSGYDFLKEKFLSGEWFVAFDLLEIFASAQTDSEPQEFILGDALVSDINDLLESELSGFRIINRYVTPLTGKAEIAAIEEAMACPCDEARQHLDHALSLISNRTNPDPRNSVKESISAVEAACREISGLPKATLSDALKKIPGIHPALFKSLMSLYGYTSDGAGIRHAITANSESLVDIPTALFMLTACSSFISYLYSTARPNDERSKVE